MPGITPLKGRLEVPTSVIQSLSWFAQGLPSREDGAGALGNGVVARGTVLAHGVKTVF